MAPLTCQSAARRARATRQRGFTLIELMVAMSGGLFVAMIVFALAKDGARFYTREARVADATLGAVAGFERLRADIARSAFMASRNIQRDPRRCGNVTGWPAPMQALAGIQITTPAPDALATLNGIAPDSIILAGNFSGVDMFPIIGVRAVPGGFQVDLQTNIGPLLRLGWAGLNVAAQGNLLTNLFPAGYALRIVDPSGDVQYGVITGANATGGAGGPTVILAGNPALQMRQAPATTCGLTPGTRGSANVVSFVRYRIGSAAAIAGYAPLYAAGATPWDAARSELIREELSAADGTVLTLQGQPVQEVVSEYAVDLKLGITVQNAANGRDAQTLQTIAPGDAAVASWASSVQALGNPLQGPEFIRTVRVRLSVRSREPDRPATLPPATVNGPLYRFRVTQTGEDQFARVRTVQADVALHNQMSPTW